MTVYRSYGWAGGAEGFAADDVFSSGGKKILGFCFDFTGDCNMAGDGLAFARGVVRAAGVGCFFCGGRLGGADFFVDGFDCGADLDRRPVCGMERRTVCSARLEERSANSANRLLEAPSISASTTQMGG